MNIKMKSTLHFLKYAFILLSLLVLLFLSADAAGLSPVDINAAAYFNKSKVMDIFVEMKESDLRDIEKNPLDEKPYPVIITINGERFENVALRTKGNSTLLHTVKEGVKKLAFKIDFAEYYYNTYHGIEVINLNTEFVNPSFMREPIMYDVFSQMGVPTPLQNFAKLHINGKLHGYYYAVENYGIGFLARNYNNPYGELYKPDGAGANLEWLGEDKSFYKAFAAKTSPAKNRFALMDMLFTLNHTNNKELLDRVLNMDEIIRCMAVNAAFVNYDSYMAINPHNYYLYDIDGRFEMLPWDVNMSFGGKKMKNILDIPLTDLSIEDPTDNVLEEKILLKKIFSIPEYKEQYYEHLKFIAKNIMNPAIFEAKINELDNLVSELIDDDDYSLYSMTEYEEDKRYLIDFNKKRAESILKQLETEVIPLPVEAGTETVGEEMPQRNKRDLQWAFKKLVNRFVSDINAIRNTFTGGDIDYSNVDLVQLEDDLDLVEQRYIMQRQDFINNTMVLAVLMLVTAAACIVLSKKRRI